MNLAMKTVTADVVLLTCFYFNKDKNKNGVADVPATPYTQYGRTLEFYFRVNK